MKYFQTGTLAFLFIIITGLSILTYQNEAKKRVLKADLIELSKVKYGLFNVDEWKEILTSILTKKIEEFNLDDTNKERMKEKISNLLSEIIDQFEGDYKVKNRKKSFLGLSFKNTIASGLRVFPMMKDQIPDITDSIINFLDDPSNRERIRQYLLKKMDEYADRTFADTDYRLRDQILARYGFDGKKSAIPALHEKIDQLNKRDFPYIAVLFVAAIILAIQLLASKEFSANDYTLITLSSLTFLMAGLLLPMIDIDARISEMNFKLLGESVKFSDQVLYFKSKSILEIVYLMLAQAKLDLLIVGVLVLTFSVLFPVLKLICLVIYSYSTASRQSKFVQLLVFKTGKWSMADVMVIAIFMAYIGFSGIITEQLKQLEVITKNMEILTTNHSDLQLGFFLFLSFVILSLLISQHLQRDNA